MVLYYVVKEVMYVGFEYFVDLYVINFKGWIEKYFGVFQMIMSELDIKYFWLYILIKFVKLVFKKEKVN